MKMFQIAFASLLLTTATMAQSPGDLPYHQIPDYPDKFTAGTVAARLVDGLGFRYYWGTEGLRPEDLQFRPGEDARTTRETLDHIYGLTLVIVNSTTGTANESRDREEMTFDELRRKTLENIQLASKNLAAASDSDMENFALVFRSDRGESTYPFWNNINGPIADAIWHVGQVVSFRRSSGNPFNSNVSVLAGRLRQ